ncbi:MAG TPA: SUMF1/EgtB/PvdO family nonheme iron enzyme [Lentisphaeria bacterium]|nr:SUMF1/EgtB/PvdO family nonheme iron enzyme [Lentisphaeria bacterium]
MKKCKAIVRMPQRISRLWLLSCMALLLAPAWMALAQTAPAPTADDAAQAEKGAFFPALEEYEKRGKVLLIREKMLFEITAREERVKKLDAIAVSFQAIRRLKDGDEQLTQYLQLRRRVLETIDEISDTNKRQVELAAMVDTAMTAGGLLPQVSTYLHDVRRQLLDMGVQQKTAERRLQALHQAIKAAIQNIPPPAVFVNKTGIEMRLVGAGREMFYVSSRPIPGASFQALQTVQTPAPANPAPAAPTAASTGDSAPAGDISMAEAVNFTRWLSEQEGVGYRLPEVAEVTVLQRAGVLSESAVWTLTPWRPANDLEFGRMCERFGVTLYHIWDPKRVFGGEVFWGELPEARYPGLGFLVVTSAQTGWLERWNRINAQL